MLSTKQPVMTQNIQYVTDETGERVSVLIDVGTYNHLISSIQDPELLANMSQEELVALSEAKLAIDTQDTLNNLLSRNTEEQLSSLEQNQLDYLLNQLDNLNVLKARAKYTLNHLAASIS